MMQRKDHFAYAEQRGYQAVELPYANDRLSMIIVLPELGAWETSLEAIGVSEFETLLATMEVQEVELKVPKFDFRSPLYQLREALETMGMHSAFSLEANFSRMTTDAISIGDVYHTAYLALDEEGTEAAAATAVENVSIALPPNATAAVEMHVNRPFLVLIRDTTYDQIVFMGAIENLQ
jgi:serpin B